MDELVLLVGSLLAWLRGALDTDVCPGEWAWATTGLGAVIGLWPAVTAIAVARLRYQPGRGLLVPVVAALGCGLLPWLIFSATGRLFAGAARGASVGLDRADRASLTTRVCFGVTQQAYLGRGSVTDVLSGGSLRGAVLLVPLLAFPVLVLGLVWLQGRLALRRGPRWPNRFLWLPVALLAVATSVLPAGSTAHGWTGMLIGSIAGLVVTAVAPPARAPQPAIRRSRPMLSSPRPAPARPAGAVRARDAGTGAAERLRARLGRTRTGLADARRWLDGAPARMRARIGAAEVAMPAPVVPRPRPPHTLVAPAEGARFELVRQLGAGGFGGVWLAHDHARGHRVALKAAHVPDEDTERRIRREARALGAVRHPHCVPIFDLVDSRRDPGLSRFHGLVIVMAYLEGCSLDQLVRRRGPLDDVTLARTWAGLADALGAAHHHGVLHRDVKPGNVLVDPAGRPHLIDFGIARARGDQTLTLHGFVLGTPDYLAPEVARGGPATSASDTWQLAATMSFALTGWPPRGGHQDPASGLRAAASGEPPSHLPAGGVHTELLRACLAESPAARPSLDTTRAVLQRWLTQADTRRVARR